MSGYSQPTDDVERLAQKIQQMDSTIRDLSRPRPVIIPILDTTPDDSDPANVWLLPDGRLRIRHRNAAGTAWVIREFQETTQAIQAHNNALHAAAGAAGAGGSASAVPPAPPKPAAKTFTKTWAGTWSASYEEDDSKRTEYSGKRLYYGYGDSFNGRQKSLIGFDASNIQSTLSGCTIKSVKLRLHNVHAYWNDGATIYFGVHNNASEPGSFPSLVRNGIAHSKFGKPQLKTVTLPLIVGALLRAGTGKGIALTAPGNSSENYGWAGGVGSSYTDPALIITYVK